LEKLNAAAVKARLKELRPGNAKPQLGAKSKQAELGLGAPGDADEAAALKQWLSLSEQAADLKKSIREAEAALDAAAYAKYAQLNTVEIQSLVVDDKWLAAIGIRIHGEVDRVSQALTSRIGELADRYAAPLPELTARVAEFEAKVAAHLAKMGHY
jgi:type I restriction enzyme M protein